LNYQHGRRSTQEKQLMDEETWEEMEPLEVPIDGTLDLHNFQPREIKDLVPDYLEACREKGILQVRIVHGKGTGALRQTVHAVLERLPEVESFRLGGMGAGGWGATLVVLKRA
jgi:dsDNA-specific endonuclease/ATPase MutS2